MEYLLDTNICIYYFKGQFNLREKIERIGYSKIAISEVTLAELIQDAEKSQKKDANLKVIENFSDKVTIVPIFEAIRIYGKEKARLKTKGKIISDFDLLIGATSIFYDMIMVTRNVDEFIRMTDIRIENWTEIEKNS